MLLFYYGGLPRNRFSREEIKLARQGSFRGNSSPCLGQMGIDAPRPRQPAAWPRPVPKFIYCLLHLINCLLC